VNQSSNPLDVQVGGDHYNKDAIQPIEFVHSNSMGFCEGSIIKYVARHKRKGGKQDLLKARHFIDLLIALEYPEFEAPAAPKPSPFLCPHCGAAEGQEHNAACPTQSSHVCPCKQAYVNFGQSCPCGMYQRPL
jgi:hypothetical protein